MSVIPSRGIGNQVQEKPGLQEAPERAPFGIDLGFADIPADTTLFTSEPSHLIQVTEETSEVVRILSKFLPHFLQENLYIGITHP